MTNLSLKGNNDLLASKADINSPSLTGTPTTPTATDLTSTSKQIVNVETLSNMGVLNTGQTVNAINTKVDTINTTVNSINQKINTASASTVKLIQRGFTTPGTFIRQGVWSIPLTTPVNPSKCSFNIIFTSLVSGSSTISYINNINILNNSMEFTIHEIGGSYYPGSFYWELTEFY